MIHGRSFSTASSQKKVAILANSRHGDLVGARLVRTLKQVSGEHDLEVVGYGGDRLAQEGQ
jgi:lipid A disaccharide synthetase